MKKTGLFILCILLPLSIGVIGGIATSQGLETWYDTINKPSFNPPNYLFGPVWTCLYILMGISLYLILTSKTIKNKKPALIIFSVQFILNLIWSFIFFKFHLLGWAFVEILILWISILSMIIVYYKINKTASILQIPYLLWVSFASVLSGAFWVLN